MKQMFIKTLPTGERVAFKYNNELGCYVGKSFKGIEYYTEGKDASFPILTEAPVKKEALNAKEVIGKVISSKSYVEGFKNQRMALGTVVKNALTYDIGFNELIRQRDEAMENLNNCSDEEEIKEAKKELNRVNALIEDVFTKTVKRCMAQLNVKSPIEGEIEDVIEVYNKRIDAYAQYPSPETNKTLVGKLAYALENNLLDNELLKKLGRINNIAGRKAGEKIIDIKNQSEVADVKPLGYQIECEFNRELSLSYDREEDEIKLTKKLFYFEKEEDERKEAPVLIKDKLADIKEIVFNKSKDNLEEYTNPVENPELEKTVNDYLESLRCESFGSEEEEAEYDFINEMFNYLIDLKAFYGIAAKYTFSENNDNINKDEYDDEEKYQGAIFEMWDILKGFIQNSAISYARDILGVEINSKTRSLIFIAAVIASKLYRTAGGNLIKSNTTSNFVTKCFRSYYINYLNEGKDTMEFSISLPSGIDAEDGEEVIIVNGLCFIPGTLLNPARRFMINDNITVTGKIRDNCIVYDYKIFMDDEDDRKYYHVARLEDIEDMEDCGIKLGNKTSFLIDSGLIESKEDLENAVMVEGYVSDYVTFKEFDENKNVVEVIVFVTLDEKVIRDITEEEIEENCKLFEF